MSAFLLRSAPEKRICRIEINRIEKSPYQPRRLIDEAALNELAESLRRFGQLTPILVRRKGANFELISGERRLRALRMLGAQEIDAVITAAYDRDCALIALIENIEREDIHYLDQAEAFRRLLREHGMTQEELAAAFGKSQGALANLLRLLRLEDSVQTALRKGNLSERHARALLKLKSERDRLKFAEEAVQRHLSVRQLEALIERRPNVAACKNAQLVHPLIKDNRLIINAFQDTMRRLKRIGVSADSRVETFEDRLEIVITVHPPAERDAAT